MCRLEHNPVLLPVKAPGHNDSNVLLRIDDSNGVVSGSRRVKKRMVRRQLPVFQMVLHIIPLHRRREHEPYFCPHLVNGAAAAVHLISSRGIQMHKTMIATYVRPLFYVRGPYRIALRTYPADRESALAADLNLRHFAFRHREPWGRLQHCKYVEHDRRSVADSGHLRAAFSIPAAPACTCLPGDLPA